MNNLPSVIRQFNWIDIFVIILSLRILYISFKNGMKFEFFKVLGALAALYFSLHYYTSLSAFFNERISNRQTPSSFFDTLAFLLLICAGYAVFFLLRVIVGKFVKTELNVRLDKWGGLALGLGRALITVSVFLCLFLATSGGYFKKSIHSSFSGTFMAEIGPATYSYFWNGIVAKLQKDGNMNPAVDGLTKL